MSQSTACTLLIVDDSPEDRQMMVEHIQNWDTGVAFNILEASDVHEGLTLCEQVAIDCALVDYRLPDASGLDFMRALFKRHDTSKIGVVFVTGMGSEELAVKAMREGAVDYVSKNNMKPESLMRALEHARAATESARKLAQAEHARLVAQSEQMRTEGDLQRLLESIRDYAIITLDLEGRVVRWGAGARRLLGYHDDEAVGLRFSEMLHYAHDGAVASDSELESARHEPVNCDGRWFVHRDGSLFWGTSLLTPIDDELGDACGFALVIHDISVWRDVTRSLRADADGRGALKKLVEQLRVPLNRLQEGLQNLNKSGGQSAAVASLLRQLRGVQDTLESSAQEETQKAGTNHEEEQVSLAEVLKHYTAIGTPAPNAPVALRGEAAEVRGPWDARMLMQAFENIFSHARKIDPGVTIEVQPQREGDQVSVGMVFNAQNMPIAPMFEPYACEPRSDGESDLRLAVARFIIENLGGRVGERRVRKDSVDLHIYLPLTESAHA